MSRLTSQLIAALCFAAIFFGCASTGGRLSSVKSDGVEQIPTTVGIYPLLSTPIGREWRGVRALQLESHDDKVYIVPPTESKLAVTTESTMMTGLISTELSFLGFTLKEVPVEANSNGGDSNTFVISLNLLRELRERYQLGALLIGNAFFMIDNLGEKRLTAAHMKVVDVESLDILGQLSFSYSSTGVDVNRAAESLALELARMADLVSTE